VGSIENSFSALRDGAADTKLALWSVLYTPPYVLVDSMQTPRTLIHLSKVHTDSVQTLHGLRMDFARTYILQ
jgi:hypothetical protein